MENWLSIFWSVLIDTSLSVAFIFVAMIFVVRIAGLRTFAKMSSFDFASTIAIGSILASVIMADADHPWLRGVVALVMITLLQQVFAQLKFRSDRFEDFAENQPILLMDDGKFLTQNMASSGVSRSDLIAKLREANVIQLSEVRAVVLETTGDVSVLHTSGDEELESVLLEGVKTPT